MNKKETNFILNELFNVIKNTRCEFLHHDKKNQHKDDEICPVEYELNRKCYLIEEYINNYENKINELEEELKNYRNHRNWTRPYDYKGNLIPEHALYKPKIKKWES